LTNVRFQQEPRFPKVLVKWPAPNLQFAVCVHDSMVLHLGGLPRCYKKRHVAAEFGVLRHYLQVPPVPPKVGCQTCESMRLFIASGPTCDPAPVGMKKAPDCRRLELLNFRSCLFAPWPVSSLARKRVLDLGTSLRKLRIWVHACSPQVDDFSESPLRCSTLALGTAFEPLESEGALSRW
jgi:hypothetical protein